MKVRCLEELIERRELPTCAVHLHYAPDTIQGADVDIHDRKIWAAGNPGTRGGNQVCWRTWWRNRQRVAVTPMDLNSFLAFDSEPAAKANAGK